MPVISQHEYKKGLGLQVPSVPDPVLSEKIPEVVEKPSRRKPKADDPWFNLEHPDNSVGNQISCKFDLEIDGEKYPVEIEFGRVETQEELVKAELVRRGYRFMNQEY